MSILVWDETGKKTYETGVSNVVLFPTTDAGTYAQGVAWNGVSAINENPSGADQTKVYADNQVYLTLTGAEDYGFTIEAYDSPDEFDDCDGTRSPVEGVTIGQQTRTPFGIAYKTLIANDTKSYDYGYKLHLVFNCTAKPTSKSHGTISDSPQADAMSWEVSTTPINVTGYKPSAHVTLDSTKIPAEKLKKIEDMIFGTAETESKLPSIDEVIKTIKEAA